MFFPMSLHVFIVISISGALALGENRQSDRGTDKLFFAPDIIIAIIEESEREREKGRGGYKAPLARPNVAMLSCRHRHKHRLLTSL